MSKKYTIADLQKHGLLDLDVYVSPNAGLNRIHCATLSKEGARYVLTYLPKTSADCFVSLSMPVRTESWVSGGRIHPFFEVNLPEGTRREALASTFGKAMISEDMSLLALTGNNAIGRVFVVPSGFPLDWKPVLDFNVLDAAHTDSDAFFASAWAAYSTQGISGVQPKVMGTSVDRVTMGTRGHIMKHDGDEYPFASINELLSMGAARRSGLDVPDCLLSDDGKSLFVERFDHGGFEDLCALMGFSAFEKYGKSIEQMMKVVTSLVSSENVYRAKKDILKSVIFNACIGNSDAHLKNYALVYERGTDARLSPFYDLVCTRAYKNLVRDLPSISIGGKLEWVIGKAFHRFAATIGISGREVAAMVSEVTAGVGSGIGDIVTMVEKFPAFREHAKSMIRVWGEGLHYINGEKFFPLDHNVLERHGMSPSLPQKKEKEGSNSLIET